jgi:DNA-binding transcriptional LysR family regulator
MSGMSPTNLDLDTLRTLATAEELGGYGRAAERLGRTPSAVSLQMKRLQDDAGARLFRKSGRGLALTEAGELVLRYGRRMLELNDELLASVRGGSAAGAVRFGVTQDFAGDVLPQALSELRRFHPHAQVEVRIEGSGALGDAVEAAELDVALALGQAQRAGARTLGDVPLVWIAPRGFRRVAGEPLPLALLGARCAFRQQATRALDEAGIAWRVAAVSPSLGGLWATAQGGLGLTVRTLLGVPAGLRAAPTLFGLPRLGAFPVTLHARPGAGPPAERLAAIVAEVAARVLPEAAAARRP